MITSKENQTYRHCVRLSARKYRQQYGEYLIEGEKLIREAIKTGQRLKVVVAAESSMAVEILDGIPCGIVRASDALFSQMAQTENSQGILAVVQKEEHDEEFFRKEIRKKQGNVIVLDRLQDPGNIGTIIRTADAAGYSGVMTIKGTADLFSPNVVRAAAGSLFRMPVFSADSPEEAIRILEKEGKLIVATGFETEILYYEAQLTENVGLIIGNEGNGISADLMRMAHKIVKIPMSGEIDSLNAAVAAGILMYESIRENRL